MVAAVNVLGVILARAGPCAGPGLPKTFPPTTSATGGGRYTETENAVDVEALFLSPNRAPTFEKVRRPPVGHPAVGRLPGRCATVGIPYNTTLSWDMIQ